MKEKEKTFQSNGVQLCVANENKYPQINFFLKFATFTHFIINKCEMFKFFLKLNHNDLILN